MRQAHCCFWRTNSNVWTAEFNSMGIETKPSPPISYILWMICRCSIWYAVGGPAQPLQFRKRARPRLEFAPRPRIGCDDRHAPSTAARDCREPFRFCSAAQLCERGAGGYALCRGCRKVRGLVYRHRATIQLCLQVKQRLHRAKVFSAADVRRRRRHRL